MGGNITLNYALRRPSGLSGAIVTGPWLKLGFEPPALQTAIARVIGSIMPAFSQQAKLDVVEASKMQIAFGSQIRSYVLHPYRMIKDHRTKYEVGDTDRVLDGDLDGLIKSTLIAKAKGTLGQAVAADD
jgi:alpha-beta hydrolase superfamily lysophospholipase